jgi:multiple RNA-binding domain-containing protein 1
MEHFGSQGTVTDVRIIKNKQTGESRQFGYIGFASEKEAKQARKYFNNTFVDTRRVEVHIAKPVRSPLLHFMPHEHADKRAGW